jgi:hypothetical protein
MFNNKVQELTGSTPFSLMFGRTLNEMKDYSTDPAQPVDMDEWKAHQEKVVSLIFPSIHERIQGKQAATRRKLDAIRKKVTADELAPGTLVMIKDPAYLLHPSLRPSTEPEWIGPYTIVRRTRLGPYVLRDDTGAVYHRHVNYDHMKVLFGTDKMLQRTDDEDNTYVVDYVAAHREEDREYKYKVVWKGYNMKDATWESEEAFNDPQPVERYWKLQALKQQAKRVSSGSVRRAAALSMVLHTVGQNFTRPSAFKCRRE